MKNYLKPVGIAVVLFVVVLLLLEGQLWLQQNRWIKACEQSFGPLNRVQKDSIRKIVRAFRKFGDGDPYKLVYILATTRHESNFKPIKERRAAPSQTDVYARQNRYWYTGYFGRGFVQLTWQRNYAKMSRFLGVDLVKRPNLALVPKYAAWILVYGMINGSFTRRALNEFINDSRVDYYQARKTVNGLDKAHLIATYALALSHYGLPAA